MSYRNEFEKIIEHIKIAPNAPIEEVNRQFLPLIQFIMFQINFINSEDVLITV